MNIEAINFYAEQEGWAIFNAEGSSQNSDGRSPYQIQRCDEAAILESDYQAWELALSGRAPHHRAAVVWLAQNSPGELEFITSNLVGRR